MQEDSLLKNTPITLPDGTTVKKGMTVYTIQHLSGTTYDEKNVKSYYRKFTGSMSCYLVPNTVVSVNQSANARTFTIKSDRGCEHTYSVRNTCLPDMFGHMASAKTKLKQITEDDISKLQKKIIRADERLQDQIKDHKQAVQKYKATITKLKAIKH